MIPKRKQKSLNSARRNRKRKIEEEIIEAQMITEEAKSVSNVAETAVATMESVSVEKEEFKQVEKKKESETEITETTFAESTEKN